MGTYRPLYSLRVEHDYYDNLACRALAFRLKAGGVDLCRRRGLLFRQTAVNEWTLLYDCDSAGVDTSSDKVEAEFCITDPAFVLFTDWAALRPENAYTLELPANSRCSRLQQEADAGRYCSSTSRHRNRASFWMRNRACSGRSAISNKLNIPDN